VGQVISLPTLNDSCENWTRDRSDRGKNHLSRSS
jgi:hypothetical protein